MAGYPYCRMPVRHPQGDVAKNSLALWPLSIVTALWLPPVEVPIHSFFTTLFKQSFIWLQRYHHCGCNEPRSPGAPGQSTSG